MSSLTPRTHRARWLVVPENVDKAMAIAFVRVFIGVFWIFEVTVGHNWKIGGFGSGGHPGWVGPGAGDTIREEIALAVEDGTWQWVGWLYETLLVPNAVAFSYLVIALQLAFGLFFIFGFMVRPIALLALAFDLSIYFLGNSRIPPFFSAAHLFVLVTGAGMYYGADGWLTTRLRDARSAVAKSTRWLIDLPFLRRDKVQSGLLAATVLLAMYFFLETVARPTPRLNMVSMELAFLFGAVAAGLYFARRATDTLSVVVALLRVFVGFKFLHEIWVRTQPGVNGLPGWSNEEALGGLFGTISEKHWGLFGWIVDTAVLPLMGLWVVVFGIVQLGVGAALVLGWKTRYAAIVGLVYVGGLGVFGFTRYAPFVFGLLVAVLALDAGRALSFDSRTLADRPPRYGLPIHARLVPVLLVLAAVNTVAAAITLVSSGGVLPGEYEESMQGMTTAMVAIFSGLFALMGWLQMQSKDRGKALAAPEREVVPTP